MAHPLEVADISDGGGGPWFSADMLLAADGQAVSEWALQRLVKQQVSWLVQLQPEEVESYASHTEWRRSW